jgi:hypothetical protein
MAGRPKRRARLAREAELRKVQGGYTLHPHRAVLMAVWVAFAALLVVWAIFSAVSSLTSKALLALQVRYDLPKISLTLLRGDDKVSP